jgi:hypothetical protein
MFEKNDEFAQTAGADLLSDRLLQAYESVQCSLDRLEDRLARKEKELLAKTDSLLEELKSAQTQTSAKNPEPPESVAPVAPPETIPPVTVTEIKYAPSPEAEAEITALKEKLQRVEKERNEALNRADALEGECNFLKRERDLAIRAQTLSPEQKQNLVRLEHESYKIAEIHERLNYVIETVRSVLEPEKEKA